jgi:hypothetical protein
MQFFKGPYVIRLIHMAYHSYWCAHSAATAGLYVYSDKFGNISLCMSEPFEFVIWSQLGNGLLQEKIYAQILCGKCLNLPAYLMHQPVLSYALPFLSPHRTCAQRWFTDFSFSPAATCHYSSTQASRAQPWMLAERAPRRETPLAQQYPSLYNIVRRKHRFGRWCTVGWTTRCRI